MKHYASSRFWDEFNKLPAELQQLARQKFELLKQDPSHSSLQFKFVNHGRLRSVRISIDYRALGIPVPDGVQWFWIGPHAKYDQMI